MNTSFRPWAALAVLLVSVAGCAAPTEPSPPSSSPPSSSPPSSSPAGAVTQFPLDTRLFGLDEAQGQSLSGVWLAPSVQRVQYGLAGDDVVLWVFAPGEANRVLDDPHYVLADAPDVGGFSAQYVETVDGPVGLALHWQADAQAVIFARVADEAALLQLGQSLRTDVNEPVDLGFTVPTPDGLAVAWTAPLWQTEDSHTASLYFGLDGQPLPIPPGLGATSSPYVEVSVGLWAGNPGPNTTIGGHPAYVRPDNADPASSDPNPYSVYLFGIGSSTIHVYVSTSARSVVTNQAANDLALSVTLV